MWKPNKPPFIAHKKHVFRKAMAVSDFIYQIGESPLLRESSTDVPLHEICSDTFQKKLAYVKKCLFRYRELTGAGRGITAVQVGIPERFSVIYMPELPDKVLTLINPELMSVSKDLLLYPEICMSAAPIIAPTVRPAWAGIIYYDDHAKKQEWKTKAETKEGRLYNRVLQHEIDHMNGIINIDRVASSTLILESDPTFYEKAGFEEVKK